MYVLKGLDAESITTGKEALIPLVIDGESPHAHEALHTSWAPLHKRLEQDFGVATCVERVAEGLQLLPDLDVVVDLAIEYQHELTLNKRLVGAFTEVDYAQSIVAKTTGLMLIYTTRIWTTMMGCIQHLMDERIARFTG